MKRLLLICLLVVGCSARVPFLLPAVEVPLPDEARLADIHPQAVRQITGQFKMRMKNPLYKDAPATRPASQPAKPVPQYVDVWSRVVPASVTTLWKRGEWVYGLTAKHVVYLDAYGHMERVTVEGQAAEVVVLGEVHDWAVVRWRPRPGAEYPTVRFAEAEVGQSARAVGFPPLPLGSQPSLRHVTRGWVTLKEYGYLGYSGGCRPGMSGGALVDDVGRVIGIISLWYPGCDSFGYCVDAQYVHLILRRIPADK